MLNRHRNRKRTYTQQLVVAITPEMYQKLQDVAAQDYNGNVSDAVRTLLGRGLM